MILLGPHSATGVSAMVAHLRSLSRSLLHKRRALSTRRSANPTPSPCMRVRLGRYDSIALASCATRAARKSFCPTCAAAALHRPQPRLLCAGRADATRRRRRPPPPSPPAALAPPLQPLRLRKAPKARAHLIAQHDVVSFGTNEEGFVNASIGVRIDYAATPAFRIGVEIAYANLEGDTDRAHSLLGLLQFEGRAAISENWSVPARIAFGHLASNGAVLRLASGVAVKLSSRFELVLEVVPTLFSTRDGVYPSVGPGLELSFSLP